MWNNLTWTLFLIIPCVLVSSRPMQPQLAAGAGSPAFRQHSMAKQEQEHPSDASQPDQVISVRITSSVAVGRGKGKQSKVRENKHETLPTESYLTSLVTEKMTTVVTQKYPHHVEETTILPSELQGANIEFIRQLNSKKEARGLQNFERIHSFATDHQYTNDTEDSVAEPSLKSVLEVDSDSEEFAENEENVPLARSVSLLPSSKNYIQGLAHKPLSERRNNQRLTTVSFNILHDTPKSISHSNVPNDMYSTRDMTTTEPTKLYNAAPKYFNEPAKVYSQPAQVYSEPAKFYSEPAKVYSEPAKIYSEPAKIYSEPAKVYSEPAKFYSQPASLHLPPVPPNYTPWQEPPSPTLGKMMLSTTPITTVTIPPAPSTHRMPEHQPERNYEVDEKVSVLTDGRSHGVQETTTESCKQENCKVGYVVEGRQYRKYRVEERTADGFIVGEYGVVRHEDGALRGVRYTADSDASPRLIYDALMKFLQLK